MIPFRPKFKMDTQLPLRDTVIVRPRDTVIVRPRDTVIVRPRDAIILNEVKDPCISPLFFL
jgi:hypothetical protein